MNKQIHRDEFRLRVLCTDKCNETCRNCLNDFQEILHFKNQGKFLSLNRCKELIEAYSRVECDKHVVTFSGGEPGLWNGLSDAVTYAKELKNCVKVCTNGKAFDISLEEKIDRWHWHYIGKDCLPKWIKKEKLLIQYVMYDNTSVRDLHDFFSKYENYSVKIFVDYYSNHKQDLYTKLDAFKSVYEYDFDTRFTGIQENRGRACEGCSRECVTLKGVWAFPDGSISTCPQGVKNRVYELSNMGLMKRLHESYDNTGSLRW